jgi:PAS domain S-box-containing protein
LRFHINVQMTSSDLVALDLLSAVDDLAAPAYVITREGRFSWVNRAFAEQFGDLRGRSFLDRVAPEHRQLSRMNFTRKVVGKTTQIFDMVVLDRDGGRVPMRFTSAPLRRNGEVVGVFGVAVPLARSSNADPSPLDELTPRQQEVLRLLGEGLETPEIASRLGVAEETARNHIRAMLRATGAHSRLEAVLMGLRSGLISTDLTHAGHQFPGPATEDGS